MGETLAVSWVRRVADISQAVCPIQHQRKLPRILLDFRKGQFLLPRWIRTTAHAYEALHIHVRQICVGLSNRDTAKAQLGFYSDSK